MLSAHKRRLQSGQAAVEGALVSLVFLVLIFGLMDFARMVWSYTMISHGAREATRYAMVHGSSSGHMASVAQIQNMVTSTSPGIDAANLTATVTFAPDQSPGSTARVVVIYNFYPIAPYIPIGPLQLTSTSEMVICQ
jgi:Flp pilus assembly protein TadG